MSKYTKEDMEKAVAAGTYERVEATVVLYRNKAKPYIVKKLCPCCGKVYDKFLVFAGPVYGCRTCCRKQAVLLGIQAVTGKLDEIEKAAKDF
jgi:hypothetical protein